MSQIDDDESDDDVMGSISEHAAPNQRRATNTATPKGFIKHRLDSENNISQDVTPDS